MGSVALLALTLSASLISTAPALAAAQAVSVETSPANILRQTTDQLLAEIETRRAELDNGAARRNLVRQHVAEHVDNARIARMVLGKHWRRASADERTRFTVELERMMYRAFAELLVGDEVQIDFGASRGKPGRISVLSTLRTSDARNLDVRFRMSNGGKGWKLYDLVVEGVSLVTTYRSAFDIEVRKNGLSALITTLKSKNDELDSN